jgi:hypothetical protein
MSYEDLGWFVPFAVTYTWVIILGYLDFKFIHEILIKRDRSVPVRWVKDRESIGYLICSLSTIPTVFVIVALPLNTLGLIFFLGIFLIGGMAFISYIFLNLEYKLPPSDGVEQPIALDRPWSY